MPSSQLKKSSPAVRRPYFLLNRPSAKDPVVEAKVGPGREAFYLPQCVAVLSDDLDLLQREVRLRSGKNAGYGLVVPKIFFCNWNASSRSPGQANAKRTLLERGESKKWCGRNLLIGRIESR